MKIIEEEINETKLSKCFENYFAKNNNSKADFKYIPFDFMSLYNQSPETLFYETKKMCTLMLRSINLFYYEQFPFSKLGEIKSKQIGIIRY